jgi:hypothetical protein
MTEHGGLEFAAFCQSKLAFLAVFRFLDGGWTGLGSSGPCHMMSRFGTQVFSLGRCCNLGSPCCTLMSTSSTSKYPFLFPPEKVYGVLEEGGW